MKKKLIEVALPLEAINSESIREKSIRHGHPSTLHLWWARRPLATCRAILFAQLVDDPSNFPDRFPNEDDIENERKRLFGIIEDLVKWENSTNDAVFQRALEEIKKSCGDEIPPVYDPFSGGGSIPLEAQRMGLNAFGSDLNPVAVTIGKAMIEIPPMFKGCPPIHPGPKEQPIYRNVEGLAEDVKHYGEWIRERCFQRIGHLYPTIDVPVGVNSGGTGKAKNVIAWIWARTVKSPDPAFSDVHVPLLSSFLLSSKKGKEVWLEPVVDKINRQISFAIRTGGTSEELERAKGGATAGKRQGFRCIISDAAITYDYIRSAGQSGAMGTKLVAIVAEGQVGRIFLPPTEHHEEIALSAKPSWRPELALQGKSRVNVGNYGLKTFDDLFTDRQLVALNCISDLINEVREVIRTDAENAGMGSSETSLRDGGSGAKGYAEAISVYLAFGLSRLADISNAHCNWSRSANQAVHLFGRQAVPMVWDFAETGLFSNMAGDYRTSLNSVVKVLLRLSPNGQGLEVQHDAQTFEYPGEAVISTDPPYYDNIDYADLSDFFFGWLKRSIRDVYPDLFAMIATPKVEELVAATYRHGKKDAAEAHFLNGMRSAITKMAELSNNEFPAAIYYAFKQSEIREEGISSTGWATFLDAVISAGYRIVGTWPVRTERDTGLKVGMNVLANSVVIVCRKKSNAAEIITRAEFLRALKRELPSAIAELQAASITPADMPQSAIGPGMGVFSRYQAVLEANDRPMTVKTALQLINSELDEFLNDLHGEFDAETRFAGTWFEQHGYEKGDFGSANSIALARGISVESVKHAGIVDSSAGKVRILKRSELDPDWDPLEDDHLTIWECCQHLIRILENEGEYSAAVLLKKIGSDKAEMVKDLAYYLYEVCSTKRQDAKEATSYNGLIAVWTELTRQAASVRIENQNHQTAMDI